jgi:hypothetical protein
MKKAVNGWARSKLSALVFHNPPYIVDSHFAQWYCDAVEGITAHPSLIDFPSSDRASSSPIEQA